MNKRKCTILFIVIASFLLAGVAIWIFTSRYLANKNTSNIDWTMQGYLVTADGQVQEELEISLTGKIRDYDSEDEANDELQLAFHFPDSFRYSNHDSAQKYLSDNTIQNFYHYHLCHGFGYDKRKKESVPLSFALDSEKEYLIMQWSDDSGLYLVAAVDQTQPTQLLGHFKDFLKTYGNQDQTN